MSNITTIEFVAPRAVSAGELVMDPNTGRFGFASAHYEGGQMGRFSAGSGYVVTVSGSPQPGSELWCRNGVMATSPAAVGDLPCAVVLSVISQDAAATTALISIN